MDEHTAFALDVLAIIPLVLINGIFVAAEFALVRSNPIHFTKAEARNKVGSRTALILIERLDDSLSTIQLGISIASILLGWFGVHRLFNLFLSLPDTPLDSWLVVVTLSVAALIVVFLHVVLGELVAKTIAIRHPEAVLRLLAGPMYIFSVLCKPIAKLLNRSAALILSLFGFVRNSQEISRSRSLAELSFLVSKSTADGELDEEEGQMLRGVFGLSDTVAREIMTPRTDLVAIPLESTFEEVLSTIRESGLSRFPVVGESIDDVQGILLARDILSFYVPSTINDVAHKVVFDLNKLKREAYFIPGTKPIDDLLTEFKRRKLHMAVVLDEHGGVDGVVTLEDLIEEIVGDIFDESDVPEKSIVVEPNGDVLIDGGQLVADVNSRFALDIPEGDYDTIAGFIFTSLGRMPKPGDSIIVNRAPDGEAFLTAGPKEGELEIAELSETDAVNDEQPVQARITVEKVQSYRIESVRLSALEVREDSQPEVTPVLEYHSTEELGELRKKVS